MHEDFRDHAERHLQQLQESTEFRQEGESLLHDCLVKLFSKSCLYQNMSFAPDIQCNNQAAFELNAIQIYVEPALQPGLSPDHEVFFKVSAPKFDEACRICGSTQVYVCTYCDSRVSVEHARNPAFEVYNFTYCCSKCHSGYLCFQVVRTGFKLQLTGRSSPYRPKVSHDFPNAIRRIIQDAIVAANEGDINAGYYHLRTAIEWYMKTTSGLAMEERIDGTDLCVAYNSTTDAAITSSFPSMQTLYTDLSKGLHEREDSLDKFEDCLTKFHDHLRGKALFEKYASSS